MSKDLGLGCDQYGRVYCAECDEQLSHDGCDNTYEQPGYPAEMFWCDCCDREWTPEVVQEYSFQNWGKEGA